MSPNEAQHPEQSQTEGTPAEVPQNDPYGQSGHTAEDVEFESSGPGGQPTCDQDSTVTRSVDGEQFGVSPLDGDNEKTRIRDPEATHTAEISNEESKRATDREQVDDSTRIDRFELVRLLGEGAFGTVYLAHDPQLDRPVAVKIARKSLVATRRQINRFVREARAAAQLRHPNIVPVFEVGASDQMNYIVYDYVVGTTLKDRLDNRKQLSPTEAAQLMSMLARAVHYAHKNGIVHRDLKPDNILIDASDDPHILDFGVARRVDGEDTRTREGAMLGSPAYMSPEQASGRSHQADARSDIWSLGIILNEVLTGKRPFKGSLTEVLVAVKEASVTPLRRIDSNVPADLETICLKCLAKEPKERFQTADELADELDRWLRGEPILSRPIGVTGRLVRWAKRNRKDAALIAGFVTALIIGSAVSLYFGIHASRSANEARENAEAARHSANAAREADKERSRTIISSLETARPNSVPVLIKSVSHHRATVLPKIWQDYLSIVGNDNPDDRRRTRLRIGLALLEDNPTERSKVVKSLRQDLLRANPDEFLVIREILSEFDDRDDLIETTWKVATNSNPNREERLRAFCGLAKFDAISPQWESLGSDVVALLLSADTLELSTWVQSVDLIRDALRTSLESALAEQDSRVSSAATSILAALYDDRPDVLVPLLIACRESQHPVLLNPLKFHAGHAAELLNRRLQTQPLDGAPASMLEADARDRANCVLALLALAQEDVAWPLLRYSDNNGVRTGVIVRASPSRLEPSVLMRRLDHTIESSEYAAIPLALGGYPDQELSVADRKHTTKQLVDAYQANPDPGVHSAAHWLLTQWGCSEQLAEIDRQLRSAESNTVDERRWMVNSQGQTLTIIPGPVEFLGGSPTDEPDRETTEAQHQIRIPRTFALGAREVTVEQFLRFKPDHTYDRSKAPHPDCPINRVTWFQAVNYCRWLSQQEGIPESQMCYDEVRPLQQNGRTVLGLDESRLQRTGYRLPTADEWEYACRAGTATARHFGVGSSQLHRFAWFQGNSNDKSHRSGTLMPNPFGLFDMHGNVSEWCHNWYFDEPAGHTQPSPYHEIRGGSFIMLPSEIRSAQRRGLRPILLDDDLGFRIAKTLGD